MTATETLERCTCGAGNTGWMNHDRECPVRVDAETRSIEQRARDLLWGPGDITRELNVTRAQFKRWREAGTFPEPIAEPSNGPVWLASHIREWNDDRERDASEAKAERTARRSEAVRIYRETGSVIETARRLGASRSSVIAWLDHAGEFQGKGAK